MILIFILTLILIMKILLILKLIIIIIIMMILIFILTLILRMKILLILKLIIIIIIIVMILIMIMKVIIIRIPLIIIIIIIIIIIGFFDLATDVFCSSVSKNCADTYKAGERRSGIYEINPDGSGIIDVFCDQTTAGGGWLVFQKRLDGSVDFYRDWTEYKRGFGNLTGEFWLGLDIIHRLSNSRRYKLRVDLEDFALDTYYAE